MILRDRFGPQAGGQQGQAGGGKAGGQAAPPQYGQSMAPAGQGSHQPPFDFTRRFANPNTQLEPTGSVQIPQQRMDLIRQMGSNQINRGAQIAQQDLMRNYGTRGMGRSGLELGAAAQQYQRGAGQQLGEYNRGQTADQMGLEFGEAQQARGLEATRRYQQAGLNLQGQQNQSAENLARSQLGLNEAIQLGQLGLQERQQGLQEFSARDKYENPGFGLAPLYQAAQAAASAGGGGKGK